MKCKDSGWIRSRSRRWIFYSRWIGRRFQLYQRANFIGRYKLFRNAQAVVNAIVAEEA